MPPNSPWGELWVNKLGDMSMTLTFPAELTSWSQMSTWIEFSPQGANISGCTFEVGNVPISPNGRTHNIALQLPRSHPHPNNPSTPQSSHHHIGSPDSHPCPNIAPLVYPQGLPISSHCAPSPQSSLYGSLQNLCIAEEPNDDANEPKIAAIPFWLEDLPDPVYPHVGNVCSPREPVPFHPPHSQKYYVVICSFKIGIFLEQW